MLIVKRVYVLDEEIVAVTLPSDYHVVLGHKLNGPTEVSVDPYFYTSGSDGRRILIGSLRELRVEGAFGSLNYEHQRAA